MKSEAQSKEQFEIHKAEVTYQPCFELNSSLLSRMFFIWSHQIIRKGNKDFLDNQDLSDLRPNEEAKENYQTFAPIFYSITTKTKKLFTAFRKYLGVTFLLAGILAIISNLLQFSGPIMINKILQFLNDGGEDISEGVTYVSVLVGCYLLRTILFQHSMHFVNLSCTRVMNSANTLIYHKILSLSSASRKYLEAGSIMTHINVDIMSFYYFIMMSTFMFSAPFMIVVAIVMLFLEVGWIGIAAPIIFAIGMVAQNKITKKGFELRKDQLFWTDKRTKCVNQYFSGIRIIKYYGWETLVQEKMDFIRAEEIKLNYTNLMLRTYIEIIMNMLPIFASIIIFAVYSSLEGQDAITPAKVFTVLSIFNLIAVPMRLLVMTTINFMNAKASLDRVDHFFGYEQKSLEGINQNDIELSKGQIIFQNCIFNWEKDEVKNHFEEGKKLTKKSEPKKEIKKDEVNDKKKQIKKKKKKKVAVEGEPIKKKKKKSTKKKLLKVNDSLSESLLGSSSDSNASVVGRNKNALEINNLKIHSGEFVSVVGKVGAGKSTFISSILGEIDKTSGTISRRGTTAYIPQTSWLRSASIKENILFESQYNEIKYRKILQICELETDLEILPGGDETQIGEKGVNLSGGQKQRISIARALYADADIYLIDDCLSALDPYVGKNIFFNALKEHLHQKGKTIVFVTNAIHFTEYTDRIIVIEQGKIIEDGTYDQLRANNSPVYSTLIMQSKKSKQKEEEQKSQLERKKSIEVKKHEDQIEIEDQEKTEDTTKEKEKKNAALVKVEERLKGSVPWQVYYRFLTGPGLFTGIIMFLFICLAQLSRVFSDWWLGEWGRNDLSLEQNTYIIVYAGISVGVGILIYLKGIFFAKFIISSSRVIQRKLIQTLLKTPLSWFDVTPTGRIISRTTKDQDDLDSNLAFNLQFATQNLLVLLSSVVLISVATPYYLIVALISGIIYYKLIGLYMNSSRQIKRLEANTRAPLISHISETINGTYVIRAFNRTDKFINKFFIKQKAYMVCIVNQNICNRWINIVTDLFTIVTIGAAGYFGVMAMVLDIGTKSSSVIGLALVWSLQISSIMSFTLRVMADTESCMNSVVRLLDYIDHNPSEKSFEELKPADHNWPTSGDYNIKKISYKYRPELPKVIKQISFDIKSKEKIGIVGRTGSGKSTMTLGLLRILELCENDDGSMGRIDLDNEDVSQLGLHYLRHNVTIIPQDPTLFTGTIKSNIDPFNKYTDEEIADSLQKVSLWEEIRDDPEETTKLKKKIYSKVDDSGSNFSQGQKQLICMARALIRKPKVLLMDEATASIDEKTDELIQRMIRTQFKETTVITIAHRLNTIIYYDKILVLEKGEVKEYGKPLALVRDENSFLGKLIRKTGESYMRKIIALAEETEHAKQE